MGDTHAQRLVSLDVKMTRKSLTLFQNVHLKKAYFNSLPISEIKYNDLPSLINNKILPRCHSSFYNGLKFDQE
jgi:hypothetical protein